MASRTPTSNQLAKELPALTTYITGHDKETGATTIQEHRPATWKAVDNEGMAFNVGYTTNQFPLDMNDDKDITAHDEKLASGQLGLVSPGGTVLRYVDFAPGFESMMHRTTSLDYGIVLEGAIELILDSGEKQTLHRGDSCVQRGTNHAWRNPSDREWARVVYVLQDAQPLKIRGEVLREDLGRSSEEVPASGNSM